MTNIDILRTELENLEYAALVTSQNYPAIAAVLNERPLIPNPVPQETLPKLLTLVDLFQAITPLEAIQTFQIPGLLDRVEVAINSNNRVSIEVLFEIVKTYISEDSRDNLITLFLLTELDPNWQPQVFGLSRAEELSIYPVSDINVQSALN